MIGFYLVMILFISIIAFLLWTPFRLVIDSNNEVYKVEWQSIASALLTENNGGLGVQFQIFFFKKTLPIASLFQKKEKNKTLKTKSKPPSVSKPRLWSKFKKIGLSFDVKRCKVNWDTDDYVLNAYLYPITPFLFTSQKSFSINFEGKRDIELIIENRLWRILKSIF